MRTENLQKLIQFSFSKEEMRLLLVDEAFRRMLREATEISDFEALAAYGGNLLEPGESPHNQPNLQRDAMQPLRKAERC